MSANKFKTFKEITIGGLSKRQLLHQLSEAGIQFNKYPELLFDHSQFLPSADIEKVKLFGLEVTKPKAFPVGQRAMNLSL